MKIKQTTIILTMISSALFLLTGSAIAVPVFLTPKPVSEPAIMLLFGSVLIWAAFIGKKCKKNG